jgi:hypothetical protein
MNKRSLLLVGIGVAIGYLVGGMINKNKVVTGATTGSSSLPDTSNQTLPPASTDTTGTTPPIISQATISQGTTESV